VTHRAGQDLQKEGQLLRGKKPNDIEETEERETSGGPSPRERGRFVRI